jgi:hypothetical protein
MPVRLSGAEGAPTSLGKLAQICVVPRLVAGIKVAVILAYTSSQLDQWERRSDEEDPDSH